MCGRTFYAEQYIFFIICNSQTIRGRKFESVEFHVKYDKESQIDQVQFNQLPKKNSVEFAFV